VVGVTTKRHLRAVTTESFAGDLPFGRNYPDTQDWADRDGHVYSTDNPPLLRVRRALDHVARWAA
jgi:hypothetical protein